MKVMKMDAGRTMLMHDGLPATVELTMRQATTAPARFKAALVAETPEGKVAMPFAQPTMAAPGHKAHGYTPEFRMEMN